MYHNRKMLVVRATNSRSEVNLKVKNDFSTQEAR